MRNFFLKISIMGKFHRNYEIWSTRIYFKQTYAYIIIKKKIQKTVKRQNMKNT